MADKTYNFLELDIVQALANEIFTKLKASPLATNTTYELVQDKTDGHKFTFTGSDGSTVTIAIPDTDTTYDEATATAAGLMSAEMYNKLQGIDEGANKTIVDSALSKDGTNPVEGKAIQAALDLKLDASQKGVANGVAQLDEKGQVPATQLPSYVDDVLEGYVASDELTFYKTKGEDGGLSDAYEPETGKIYVDLDTNKTYRWSGSKYVVISDSVALGETASTAFPGDKGKVAYEHVSNKENPHGVTKEQVGLGNVADIDQSKAIKKIERSGKTFTVTHLDDTTDTFDQQDTTYEDVKGATTAAAGEHGLVPAPEAGSEGKFLKGDGTWDTPHDTTYNLATEEADGLMSKDDKAKLDGISSATEAQVTAAVDAAYTAVFGE